MYPVYMNPKWPIFDKLRARRDEFGRLSELPDPIQVSVDNWLNIELAHTSTVIEGNRLTKAETTILLSEGRAVGGKPLKDYKEADNHAAAWRYVKSEANKPDSVSLENVLHIHSLVLSGIDIDAGQFRTIEIMVGGSDIPLPKPHKVPRHMSDFGEWVAQAPASPATAFEAHLRLVDIHPFTDGNGRTARLLMNLLLMKDGYLPAIIRPEDKPDYIESVQGFCRAGNALTFAAYAADALEKTYDIVEGSVTPQQRHLKGPSHH